MIVSKKSGNFLPCPEFSGRAVCVDVTEPKMMESAFGKAEKFRIVFEVDMQQEEGEHEGDPWCVWSMPFALSLHEKASLRKFLKQWFGRDLTAQELEGLDTETLIGRPASIVVTHTSKEGDPTTVYANIAACIPYKGSDPLKASGKFKRQKDREAGGVSHNRTEAPEKAAESSSSDPYKIKVHVGKCKGVDFTDLGATQVIKLHELWLPTAKANPKPSADDKRLMTAIEAWMVEFEKAKAESEKKKDDEIPY